MTSRELQTVAATALAKVDVITPYGLQELICFQTGVKTFKFLVPLKAEENGKGFFLIPVPKEPEVTDLLETMRKYMHHKTTDKLLAGNMDIFFHAGFIVQRRENNFIAGYRQYPGV